MFLFLVCYLGLPDSAKICNQRTIDSCNPTFVCFSGACRGLFRDNFRYGRSFDRWDHGFADGNAARLAVWSNFEKWIIPLSKPMSAEEAEAETRHQFAVRAN